MNSSFSSTDNNSSEVSTLQGLEDFTISPTLLTINTIALSIIAVIGFFGNLSVFVAFGLNAKLRSKHFNLILLNLTLADFGVSCILPLTILYEWLGFWPFDAATCFVYILVDYGMTTISAMTLVLISVDRCWAACWSNTYRTLNTRKRTMLRIAVLWLSFAIIWLPVLIMDRINNNNNIPGDCTFYTAEDRRFGIFYVTIGYPIPMTLMIVCNIKVYWAVQRSRASVQPHPRSGGSNTTSTTVTKSVISERQKETTLQLSEAATPSQQDTSGSLQSHVITTTVTTTTQKSSDVEKIFRSLCYIVGAYVILWLPYCLMQSVLAFTAVSQVMVESLIATNILSYSNSAVNPFLYAVGSNDFRVAFTSMFRKARCFRLCKT